MDTSPKRAVKAVPVVRAASPGIIALADTTDFVGRLT